MTVAVTATHENQGSTVVYFCIRERFMPKPTTPIESLLTDLYAADFMTRCNAARDLGKSRDARAVDALLPDLQDPDWRIRRNAAQALGVAKDKRAVEPLIAALQDRTMTVRARAAVALGRLKDARAIPALIDCLHDASYQAGGDAANALRKFGKAAFPALKAAYTMDRPLAVRQTLLQLIADTRHSEAIDILLPAINDPDENIRWQALRLVGQLGNSKAVEHLIWLLGHSDMVAEITAIRSLGELRDPRVVRPFLQLLVDHELYGRYHRRYEAITAALQMIAGVPNGFGGLVNQDLGTMLSLLSPEQINQLSTMVDTMFRHTQDFMSNNEGNRVAAPLAQQFDIQGQYQRSQTKIKLRLMFCSNG
jgi:HEAT repeat protein